MPVAKLILPAAVIALAAACGRPDHTASDTAIRASGTSAAQAAPTPTLTAAAAETAKTAPAATQSGSAKTTPKSQSVTPHATVAPTDTAVPHAPVPAPSRDTARVQKPAAAPPPSAASTPPVTAAPAATTTASAASDSLGKPAYDANCRRCHGVRGVPPRTMAAKYPKIPTFDAAFVAKVSADSIVSVLNRGVNDDMKSFKDKLTHDEIRAVAVYLRAFAK